MGLPSIDINFIQRAVTAVRRSSQGVLAVVVLDDTVPENSIKEYSDISSFEETDYTTENALIIKRAFASPINKLMVCKIGAIDEITVAMNLLENKVFDWCCVVSDVVTDQDDFASWIISRNTANAKKAKLIGYKLTTSDDIHVLNFTNDSVQVKEATEDTPGHEYLPRLASVFAYLSINQSATYYELTDLESVIEVPDANAAVENGELILINDEGKVRIARGINSLTTLSEDKTEDMKSVLIVEAMDLISYDINQTYKNDYLGKYKNSYDNQVLFLSSINAYFKALERENILESNYSNKASVAVEAQRIAWLGVGKTEAADWTEQEVKNNTFKNKLFLAANNKILNAMEDLSFDITME